MPELPEVETICRDLQNLSGQVIGRLNIKLEKITAPKGRALSKIIRGAKILSVERRAKILVFRLSLINSFHGQKNAVLLIHLKMTGQLVLRHQHALVFGGHPIVGITKVPNKYTHAEFHMRSGDILYFNDLRRFGYIKLIAPDAAAALFSKLGVEPLTPAFTFEKFKAVLSRHRSATIKAILLDQSGIAGLGNIYVDEACFLAKTRPNRRVSALTAKQKQRLWRAIPKVLRKSIRHRGTSFNTYVSADGKTGQFWEYRQVYGRKGEFCYSCNFPIKRIVVAGRGTHYCPKCQK